MRAQWSHLFETKCPACGSEDAYVSIYGRHKGLLDCPISTCVNYKGSKKTTSSGKWLKFVVTPAEYKGLSYASSRYSSADALWSGHDEDKNKIPIGYAIWAYILTGGDGGNIRTVPLMTGSLSRKIQKLFDEVEHLVPDVEELAQKFHDYDHATEKTAKNLIPQQYRYWGDD